MGTSDQVLSQAEIDAMFSATAGNGGGPPEEVPEHPLGPRPEPVIREAGSDGLTLGDVGKRLEKLKRLWLGSTLRRALLPNLPQP